MSFLAPLFLAGFAALAIPILIHLSHRTKKEAIPFPSLMFLSKVPFRTVRRQQIRHWLLFLLRSAAIILLVTAFARPLFKNLSLGAAGTSNAREIVVMMDRSFSMSYGDRWQRAVAAAHEVIDGIGPEDRVSLVFFSDRVEVASQPTGDAGVLNGMIDRARVGAGHTQYAPALQAASRILDASTMPNREAVLITDFQRTGWDDREDVRLPQGVALTRLDIGVDQASNVALTGLTADRVIRSGRERAALSVRIVNLGPEAVDGLGVTLEIDGQQMAAQSADLASNGSATVRFPPFALPRREVQGVVRTTGDALPLDDVFRFVLLPGQVLSVLILEHASARRDESLYLARALAVGTEPAYRVTVKKVTQFRPSDLVGQSAVILNDAQFPRGSRGTSLTDFVSDGGGMLIVLGQRSTGRWPAESADLLPGVLRGPVDRLSDRGGTLNLTDYDHPILEIFSAPRHGDFSQARFFRYRKLEENQTARVLARFDDGSVALAEVARGEGVAVTWTSGLADSWNDFPLQPVFLPFVHQLVKHLAHYSPKRQWYNVGQMYDIAQTFGDTVDEVLVESPSGERRAKSLLGEHPYVQLDESGFYRIRLLESDGGPNVVIAVNPSVSESDLTRLDPEMLAGAVTHRSGGVEKEPRLAATLTPAERERKQGVWWYLLMTALLILVAETAISNRISKASPSGSRK